MVKKVMKMFLKDFHFYIWNIIIYIAIFVPYWIPFF